MSPTKVAVIGLFNIGKQHLDAWSKTEGAELAAVADLNGQLCEEAKRSYPISESYGDYKQLLRHSDAEIVSICLPTGMHERVVKDCLQSGRHVVCEKPPATSTAEAASMYACSLETGKKIGYSLQRRFSPQVQAVREAFHQGRIGKLLYGKTRYTRPAPLNGRDSIWRYDRNNGGGSLLDLGVHMLDAAWYAIGCPKPVSASGLTSSAHVSDFCQRKSLLIPDNPADDTAAAWIRFADGSALLLESSFGLWTFHESEEHGELHGTEGALRIYPGEAQAITREGRHSLAAPLESPYYGHHGVTHDFLQAVVQNREPCADGKQGVVLHQMMDAIIRSAEEGREIPIFED